MFQKKKSTYKEGFKHLELSKRTVQTTTLLWCIFPHGHSKITQVIFFLNKNDHTTDFSTPTKIWSLHNKRSFPSRISSVNVTKFAVSSFSKLGHKEIGKWSWLLKKKKIQHFRDGQLAGGSMRQWHEIIPQKLNGCRGCSEWLTILTGKNCFFQLIAKMAGWLLLTFLVCLHNQFSSIIHSIITY